MQSRKELLKGLRKQVEINATTFSDKRKTVQRVKFFCSGAKILPAVKKYFKGMEGITVYAVGGGFRSGNSVVVEFDLALYC